MRVPVLAALCCTSILGCTSDSPDVAPIVFETPQAVAVPAGSPFAPKAHVHLAMYGLAGQDFAPEPAFAKLMQEQLPGVTRIVDIPGEASGPTVFSLEPPVADYPPPPAESIPHFSVGLTPDQQQALPGAERVFVTEWALSTGADGLAQLRQLMELWGQLAQTTGGVPWDDDTRQAFSVDAWEQRRTAHWQGDLPRADSHMIMHLYGHKGDYRLVTLGMDKLGLPDLTIPSIIRNDSGVMGPMINAVAQHMIEGGPIGPEGTLSLDLAAIQHTELREALQQHVIEGTGKAQLRLQVATPQEGDADNRLWEIAFPGTADAYHQAQIAMLEGMFGNSDDGVVYMEHDADLEAASARSRAELLGMKTELQGHFDQGWALLVKGPFPTTAGNTEWMWVEVRSWQGDTFEGLLINEPVEIPELKYGMTVQVTEAAFFDFRLDKADGSVMGWHATRLQAEREGMEIE